MNIQQQLEQLIKQYISQLQRIEGKIDTLMTALDDLTAQVTTNNNLLASAVVMINGIAAQITAAGGDPVALKALTDSLNANDTALAAAMLANTPAAPTPTTPAVTTTSTTAATVATTAKPDLTPIV